jgi:hypothetical protein
MALRGAVEHRFRAVPKRFCKGQRSNGAEGGSGRPASDVRFVSSVVLGEMFS